MKPPLPSPHGAPPLRRPQRSLFRVACATCAICGAPIVALFVYSFVVNLHILWQMGRLTSGGAIKQALSWSVGGADFVLALGGALLVFGALGWLLSSRRRA